MTVMIAENPTKDWPADYVGSKIVELKTVDQIKAANVCAVAEYSKKNGDNVAMLDAAIARIQTLYPENLAEAQLTK